MHYWLERTLWVARAAAAVAFLTVPVRFAGRGWLVSRIAAGTDMVTVSSALMILRLGRGHMGRLGFRCLLETIICLQSPTGQGSWASHTRLAPADVPEVWRVGTALVACRN